MDRQIVGLVLGSVAGDASGETPAELHPIVAAAPYDDGHARVCLAPLVERAAFQRLTVYGVDDDGVFGMLERRADLAPHFDVGGVAEALVGVDVAREAGRALHPRRQIDPEPLIDVALPDQHSAELRIQPRRHRGLAGGGKTTHRHEGRASGAGHVATLARRGRPAA